MDIVTKIKTLCKSKGIKISHLEREIGVYQGYLANVASGKNNLSPERIQKIAEILGTTFEYLAGKDAPAPKIQHLEPGEKIPVLAEVGAGIPRDNICTFDQDDPDCWEEIDSLVAASGEYYALRIHGNSMSPRIKHGDVVIVRLQDRYYDGDIVIVSVDGSEGLCKQIEFLDDGIILKSFNEAYKPITYTKDEIRDNNIRIVGKCVELRGKL